MKAMIVALALLAGCVGLWASGGSEDAGKTETPAATPMGGVEPNVMPVVSQPMTLKMFTNVTSSSTTKSNAEHPGWKELEKRTGIHIEFQHPAAGNFNDQLNLMIASGDYADLISASWSIIPGGIQRYMDDGVLLDLKDAVARYAPNLQAQLGRLEAVRKGVFTDKGQMYMFPFIQKPTPEQVIYGGLHLRKDWLDKYGLAVPATVDDWYKVLSTFKARDANGNGKDDEIPLSNAWNTGSESLTSINVFRAAYGVTRGFMVSKDNKILYSPLEPGYGLWLAEMRKWYAEGLIDRDYLTNDRKAIDANMLGNRIGAFAELTARGTERYLDLGRPRIPGFDLVGTPWPVATDRTGYATYRDDTRQDGYKGSAVSTAAKSKLREVTKWADYWYSDEGIRLINFGLQGESYSLADGKPVFTDLILRNPQRDASQMMAHYRAIDDDSLGYESWDALKPFYKNPQTLAAIDTWKKGSTSILLPVLIFSSEESQKLSTIMADVDTLISGTRDKVLMGLEPMESWDRVVAQIRQLRIAEAMAVYQGAYDRWQKK